MMPKQNRYVGPGGGEWGEYLSAAARSARKIPVTDEKLSMPAPPGPAEWDGGGSPVVEDPPTVMFSLPASPESDGHGSAE